MGLSVWKSRCWLVGQHCLAHATHLTLLLLPTLLVAGLAGFGWDVACFASALSIAAILESSSAADSPITTSLRCDRIALRMAWFVGPCLLVSYWIAQVERLVCGQNMTTLMAAGATCLITGTALRVAAIHRLGADFVSDIRADKELVRDGVYTWMRHPSEIGLLFIAVGGPLTLGAPLTTTGTLLVLLPISLWRMRREDAAWAQWQPGNYARGSTDASI